MTSHVVLLPSGGATGWVTGYHVSYSTDGTDWSWLHQSADSQYQLFTGSSDASTSVEQTLTSPVIARYVRLHPVTWNTAILMTFDLYGCDYEQTGQ